VRRVELPKDVEAQLVQPIEAHRARRCTWCLTWTSDMAFPVNRAERGLPTEARWAIDESQSQIGNAAGPS
jgi:hypothetical protein